MADKQCSRLRSDTLQGAERPALLTLLRQATEWHPDWECMQVTNACRLGMYTSSITEWVAAQEAIGWSGQTRDYALAPVPGAGLVRLCRQDRLLAV